MERKPDVQLDSSFVILNDPWKSIEQDIMKKILSIYPEVNKKTIFIVPPTGIDELKIPIFNEGICVMLKIEPLIACEDVKADYSYLLDFLMLRKDA
jgi:hypothetical protein